VGESKLPGLPSGLWTYNIDLFKAQRTFPTDQRKSGLPKVLPAYKNGLKTLSVVAGPITKKNPPKKKNGHEKEKANLPFFLSEIFKTVS